MLMADSQYKGSIFSLILPLHLNAFCNCFVNRIFSFYCYNKLCLWHIMTCVHFFCIRKCSCALLMRSVGRKKMQMHENRAHGRKKNGKIPEFLRSPEICLVWKGPNIVESSMQKGCYPNGEQSTFKLDNTNRSPKPDSMLKAANREKTTTSSLESFNLCSLQILAVSTSFCKPSFEV